MYLSFSVIVTFLLILILQLQLHDYLENQLQNKYSYRQCALKIIGCTYKYQKYVSNSKLIFYLCSISMLCFIEMLEISVSNRRLSDFFHINRKQWLLIRIQEVLNDNDILYYTLLLSNVTDLCPEIQLQLNVFICGGLTFRVVK